MNIKNYNKKESLKKLIVPILLLAITFIVSGTTFALWQLTLKQETTNQITSGCFKMSFQDDNPINLQNAYPITDSDGKKLTPYEFTLENTCDSYVSYQINLEILNSSTFTADNNIKLQLQSNNPKLLTTNTTVEPTLEEARNSYHLETGYIKNKEKAQFNLRLWLDENTPLTEDIMNKSFSSKITVITSHHNNEPTYMERVIACEKNTSNLADCMLENSKYDQENLIFDNTADNNLRYVGVSPNNYVKFNDESWRIIGIMNNIEDQSGKFAPRLKLIKDESIGVYSWDSSPDLVNSGHGVNEWSQAAIMKLLNPGHETEAIGGSLYWNSNSGTCYNDQSRTTTDCDFTTNGIKDKYKSSIDLVKWNTGSNGTDYASNNISASEYYTVERSTKNGKNCSGSNCNDTVERFTTWVGYVGLMYPSDYAYATTGGTSSTRNICLNTKLYNWNNPEVSDCKTNNWLYKGGLLTMTPLSISNASSAHSAAILEEGNVGWTAATPYASHPVIYLKTDVKIIGGKGTKLEPYILNI